MDTLLGFKEFLRRNRNRMVLLHL